MRRGGWIVLVLVASCYQPMVQTGIPCSDRGDCPEGQVCDRGVCGTTPAVDDASVDDTAAIGDSASDGSVDALGIDAPPGVLAWIETTPLPSARSLACLAAYNGRLYATGGSYQMVPKADVLVAPILNTGLVGAWSAGPDLPMATRWHGCAVDTTNPSLYVVGGDDGTTARTVVYRATIDASSGALGAWVAQTPLPAGRRGAGVVWAGGYLYVIAGEEADGFLLRNTVFRVATGASGIGLGTWTTTSGLLAADYVFGTAVANARIYATGGYTGDTQVRFSTIGAAGALGAFATTTALPGKRQRHVSVSDGAYVYAIAGEATIGGTNLATAYRAPIQSSGALGAWSQLPDIPLAVTYSSVAFASGRIYVAGGSDGTNQTARVFLLEGL